MSQRKTQILAAFGALPLLTLIGATAATPQDSGIDVWNGEIRMHGNNITDTGLVDGVDLSNPGSNIQLSGNQYSVSDNWVNESGDDVDGDLVFTGAHQLTKGNGAAGVAFNSQDYLTMYSNEYVELENGADWG